MSQVQLTGIEAVREAIEGLIDRSERGNMTLQDGPRSEDTAVGGIDENTRMLLTLVAGKTKLTMKNWHFWKYDIRMCLQSIPGAIDMLDGKLTPGMPGYNKVLDDLLLAHLLNAMDLHSAQGVCTLVFKFEKEEAEPWTSGTLYQHLKTNLTSDDTWKSVDIYSMLKATRMEGRDVVKLCADIDEIRALSYAMGVDESVEHYCKFALRNAAEHIPKYKLTVDCAWDLNGEWDYTRLKRVLIDNQHDLDRKEAASLQAAHPHHQNGGNRNRRRGHRPAGN